MIKVKNILLEVVNTYQIQAALASDRKVSITSILDQIRGLEKVTIVNNITPEEYVQKEKIEFTRVKIKFVTRGNPKEDILTSDMSKTDLRVPGVKSFKYKPETLRRL